MAMTGHQGSKALLGSKERQARLAQPDLLARLDLRALLGLTGWTVKTANLGRSVLSAQRVQLDLPVLLVLQDRLASLACLASMA